MNYLFLFTGAEFAGPLTDTERNMLWIMHAVYLSPFLLVFLHTWIIRIWSWYHPRILDTRRIDTYGHIIKFENEKALIRMSRSPVVRGEAIWFSKQGMPRTFSKHTWFKVNRDLSLSDKTDFARAVIRDWCTGGL